MYKKGVRRFVFTTITILILLSCAKEATDSYNDSGEKGSIRINTRGVLFDSIPDNRVSNFRVIAFDRAMNIVRSNTFYSTDTLESTITLSLYVGTYDFVFIANEPTGAVHDALNAVTTRAGLNTIQIPASQFNSNDDIPMLLVVENVEVLTNNQGVSINGGTAQSQWTIQMERMGVRFDMVLKSLNDISSVFSGLEISNMPDSVSLTGREANLNNTSRTYSYPDSQYFTDTIIDGYAWAVKVHRVIIPSNVFSPPDDSNKAVRFTALLTGAAFNPSMLVGLNISDGNFMIPPNSLFFINCNINSPTEIFISTTVTPWETVTWGSSMGNL